MAKEGIKIIGRVNSLLVDNAQACYAENTVGDRMLHNRFAEYGRNAKEWLRKCALLLPEINRRQIWKKQGFSSLFEYAAKVAGMSRSSVDEALRVLRRIEDKPELQKVIEEKGIQSVRPVAAIATVETAGFWAQKAKEMSKNTLEVYVREFKKQGGKFCVENQSAEILPREGLQPVVSQFGNATKTIVMSLDSNVAAELEKLKGQENWNELMKELLELRRQKLEAEKPEAAETESRHIPMRIWHFAEAKTRGQCGYPGCTKPYEIMHHTLRWALRKRHDPDRLVPLCKAHERLAHHGLIANEEQPVEQWGILKQPVWWDIKQIVDKTVSKARLAGGQAEPRHGRAPFKP